MTLKKVKKCTSLFNACQTEHDKMKKGDQQYPLISDQKSFITSISTLILCIIFCNLSTEILDLLCCFVYLKGIMTDQKFVLLESPLFKIILSFR